MRRNASVSRVVSGNLGLDASLLPVERLLYRSDAALVGSWRCPADSRWFRNSGPPRNHIFVFPRISVRLVRSSGERIVADPGIITLYNSGDEYSREALCAQGDQCEWFAVARDVLDEALSGGRALATADRPFPSSHVLCSNDLYFRQRRLVHSLQAGDNFDSMQVDEAILDLVDRLAVCSLNVQRQELSERHVRLVAQARRTLAECFMERLPLARLAAACKVSPWFLARVFRLVTGTTIHAYQSGLRLRASLDRVRSGEDLSTLALDLGYASHSHFTSSFRRAFGMSPSDFRGAALNGF